MTALSSGFSTKISAEKYRSIVKNDTIQKRNDIICGNIYVHLFTSAHTTGWVVCKP